MAEFFDPRGAISKSRHNLTHWQQDDAWVFVTWRLADSVPSEQLHCWRDSVARWRADHPEPLSEGEKQKFRKRFSEPFEEWLDQGHGSCLLRDGQHRKIVADVLHHFDRQRYILGAYVIMPNHVHVLFSIRGDRRLSSIVQSWKRFSARQINALISGTGRSLWQADFYDRLIRSQEHLGRVVAYIQRNPASLCEGEYSLFVAEGMG